MRDSDVQIFRQAKEELTKLRQLAEINAKALKQKYLPFSIFCKEYSISKTALLDYHNNRDARLLKKLFGKVYVDLDRFEALMVDYNSDTKKKS